MIQLKRAAPFAAFFLSFGWVMRAPPVGEHPGATCSRFNGPVCVVSCEAAIEDNPCGVIDHPTLPGQSCTGQVASEAVCPYSACPTHGPYITVWCNYTIH